MGQAMDMRLRQHMTLTPQLQEALRLLQLSSLEFEQEMRAALAANPFLEEEEDETENPPRTADAVASGPATAESTAVPPSGDDDTDGAPVGLDDFPSGSAARDDDVDWTEWSEAQSTLRDHLRRQLLLSQMCDRDRALVHLVIEALDDDGYLTVELADLAALVPAVENVEPDDLLAALRFVQTLEPAGVGARSLQECLLLQLCTLPETTTGIAVARALVEDHIQLLVSRDFLQLQQILGCSESDLHVARTLLRTLDPRPGRRFGPDETRYVVADVLVSKVRGRWTAAINPAVLPRIRINRVYAEMAGSRAAGGAQMARQLQEARWLVRNMAQRFVSIHRVAEAIVAKQRSFFDYGDVAMKPLALKDIATQLDLHESTVCRVTNGKYMATPRGLFEFKHFFSRELATDDGGACSATAIRALLKEMIANESPRHPLSDAQLARLLVGQGLHVARRTVTKYRSAMHVPSVELRRAMARNVAG